MASSSSTQLSTISQTLLEDKEDYGLQGEDDELYLDDNAQLSPLPYPNKYGLDSRAAWDKFARALHNSESERDRQLPTIRLPAPAPVADEVDTQVKSEPDEAISGWPFEQLLQVPDLSSGSSDEEDFWASGLLEETSRAQTRFPIDTNFTVASREAWANAKGKARTEPTVDPSPRDRQHNLRSRQHRIDSVIVSASEEPSAWDERIRSVNDLSQSTSRSNSTSRSTVSGNASYTSIHLRERLTKILPIHTRELLHEEPKWCVASTVKPGHPRCRTKTKGSLDVVSNVPSTLTGSTIESTDAASLTFVRDLIESAICGRNHRKTVRFEFEKICENLDDMSEDDRAVFDEWIRALASEPQSTKEDPPMSHPERANSAKGISTATPRQDAPAGSSASNHPVTRSMTRRSPPKSTTTAISTTISARDPSQPYFQNFELYQPKSTASRSISAVLHDVLMRPLTKRELNAGYIYMYWFPGNFGYLKIGKTSGQAANRLDQLHRQCKHAVESVDTKLVAVSHVFRVEALVHAELKDVRYREVNCRGCGKNHVEWFRETTQHARRVFDKWAKWMKKEPYAYVAGEPGTGWKLKQDIGKEEIEKLCQPLERLVTKPKGTSGASSRRQPRKHR